MIRSSFITLSMPSVSRQHFGFCNWSSFPNSVVYSGAVVVSLRTRATVVLHCLLAETAAACISKFVCDLFHLLVHVPISFSILGLRIQDNVGRPGCCGILQLSFNEIDIFDDIHMLLWFKTFDHIVIFWKFFFYKGFKITLFFIYVYSFLIFYVEFA